MQRILFGVCLTIIFSVGCSSRSEVLNQEYNKLSNEIHALQDERKAMVALEVSAQDYLKYKQEYEARKKKLQDLRNEHDNKGLPLGPNLPEGDLENQVRQLKQNYKSLSDRIMELERKRSKVAEQQSNIEP